jgi:mono/diheme cytochrome c family protein
MNSLFDVLLKKPIPDLVLHPLLFVTFTLHLLFVLLTLGTAILALYYLIHTWYGGRFDELRWDKDILRTFLVHKSLAVVLGVAPLLLIQVGFTVPFFTAVNFLAPFWILIIVFLIIAFLLFDALGHKMEVHPRLHLVLGLIAVISLLAVPGIFVGTLIVSENPDLWPVIARNGYRLSASLSPHWLLRYLHVVGAAVVFGAAFHYLSTTDKEREKRSSLIKWIIGGILLQFVLGIMLYMTLPKKPGIVTNGSLTAGVVAAGTLLWVIFSSVNRNAPVGLKSAVPLLLLVLVPMLLTRQLIQNRQFLPLNKELKSNALAYTKELEPFSQEALQQYQSNLKVVYKNGETIFSRSCAFCHGAHADGRGPEANHLRIPPADISAIRTTREYLRDILMTGVAGSAMPYFTVFDGEKIEGLIDDLNLKYHVLSLPGPLPVPISEATLQEAETFYREICSQCHGMDGRGSQLSRKFQPPPPDFTVHSLTPERAFEIITDGYPGTAMFPMDTLSEEVRWGLVKIINEKRKP